MVGMDAGAWKPLHDSKCTGKVLDVSHLDLYAIVLYNIDALFTRLLTT